MQKVKKVLPFFLAFLVPVLIFFGVLLVLKKTGGTATTIFSDADEQYINFLAYYRTVLLGENNLDYSFSFSIGGSFYALASYYLFSPFNLLVIFFPAEEIATAFNLILFLKIGAAGVTAFVFFREIFRKVKKQNLLAIIFGASYVLSSFTFIYFFHIMWLDGIILLPLVSLGIKKLVEEKKSLLYILSLGIGILTNFYVGFMLCIFSVIFVLYLVFSKRRKKEEVKLAAKNFILASLLAGMIGMTTLIPTILSTTGTGRFALSAFKPAFNLSLGELVRSFTTGGILAEKNLEHGLPNFFPGTLILILVILYFLNEKTSRREKIVAGGGLAVFLGSFMIRTLNSIWHLGTIEAWFRFRYSYMFSFFLVLIAAKSLILILESGKLEKIRNRGAWKVALVGASLVFLQVFDLGFNGIVLTRTATKEEKGKDLAVVETEFKESFARIKKIKEEDGGFYRIGDASKRTWNDAFGMNYNGISSFSSTLNPEVRDLLTDGELKVAEKKNNFTIEYSPGNEEAEKILGVKYRILETGEIVKNEDALEIGFLAKKDFLENLVENVDKIKNERVKIEKKTSSEIIAKVEAEEGENLIFSIPYDKNWKAEVDGEKVEILEHNLKFLELEIEPGEHEIKLHYRTRGRFLGLFIGLIGIFGAVYYAKREKLLRQEEKK